VRPARGSRFRGGNPAGIRPPECTPVGPCARHVVVRAARWRSGASISSDPVAVEAPVPGDRGAAGKAGQHIGQVLHRADPERVAGGYHRVRDGDPLSSSVRAGKEIVAATHGRTAMQALDKRSIAKPKTLLPRSSEPARVNSLQLMRYWGGPPPV
jgi:hypothetical protein